MARSQATEEPTTIASVAAVIPPVNSFEAVLAEYGVTESEMHVPVPPTQVKANFPELCVLTTELKDERGEPIKKVMGHTGPLMMLEVGEQYDGDKYPNYDGFYTYTILHPKKGKTLITLGRPVGERKPAVANYLSRLRKGAWFQVARVQTNAGFGVLTMVPVQR